MMNPQNDGFISMGVVRVAKCFKPPKPNPILPQYLLVDILIQWQTEHANLAMSRPVHALSIVLWHSLLLMLVFYRQRSLPKSTGGCFRSRMFDDHEPRKKPIMIMLIRKPILGHNNCKTNPPMLITVQILMVARIWPQFQTFDSKT